jgi:hypothetical protein
MVESTEKFGDISIGRVSILLCSAQAGLPNSGCLIGDLVTPKEELVRGGLKYQWKVLPKESEETLLSEQPATQAAPPTDTQHPPQ